MSDYDAIVIGAGHNGLVCAAYLARAGLRTVVLERNAHLGGMAGNTELLPGVRAPRLAHTAGRLSAAVARELRLAAHGLRFIRPEVATFAPQPDGRALTLWADPLRTAAELRSTDLVSHRDADAFCAADERYRDLAARLARLTHRVPAASAGAGLATLLGVDELGRTLPMAVRDLAGDWFESDALQAVIAARGVLLTGLGPYMPHTAAVLLADGAGTRSGLAGQAVLVRGGPGALANGLAAAARSASVRVETETEVVAVRRSGGAATGVVLAGGAELSAPTVVSSLDPRTTLLRLLDPEVLGPGPSWRAANIRQSGATAKVNLALDATPAFTAAAGDEERLAGRVLIAPSVDYVEKAMRAVKYGELAADPVLEATIPSIADPSLVDPALAGDVRHVMSVIVQGAPRVLRDGTWDGRREELADTVVSTLELYAPGLGASIVAREVITPLDIEHEYGAWGGHPMHAEVGLDQWFAWRPLLGLGDFRMPLSGLYLCGSGANPGGGLTGLPGRLAAAAILADRRIRT